MTTTTIAGTPSRETHPMTTLTPARQASIRRSDDHHCAHGFCTVCGSNWPCWSVQADDNLDVAAPTTPGLLALPPC